jgi:heme-degrading monooxygenase HmoA
MIAKTPAPPYYAVIFTSMRNENIEGYADTAARMVELAQAQRGYLGHESVSDSTKNAITASYWADLAAIRAWKQQTEHLFAQAQGREQWYAAYQVRICLVEREYGFFSE